MSTVTDKILNNIKYALTQFDNIENVEYNEDDKHFYVFFKNEEKIYGGDNNSALYREEISKILEKENLEIGGVGTISNWENYKAAEAEFLKENPRPVDPTHKRDWFSHTYYWRTKGEGSKLFKQYLEDDKAWHRLANAELPPRYTPGFRFDIQTLGENQKVYDFYKDTKYWGD